MAMKILLYTMRHAKLVGITSWTSKSFWPSK